MWSEMAPSPCKQGYRGNFDETGYGEYFFWNVPVGGVCAKQAKYAIPALKYLQLNYSYELRTPNPLSMKSGQYTGSINYSIGPGGDFDMGDVMLPSDGALTLNFNLDVEHVLKVDIPPGGNRVELVPEGGWQSWLQNGRVPKKLFRDQTFHISSSGPFSMRLICSRNYASNCAVQNENNHAVRLYTKVSLHNGYTDNQGQPVNHTQLVNNAARDFQSRAYVHYQPATLHFSIVDWIDEMVHDHVGTTYKGTVTVVWDSEV